MFEVLMTNKQKKLRDEVRDLVKSVPRQLIIRHGRRQDQLPKRISAGSRMEEPSRSTVLRQMGRPWVDLERGTDRYGRG